MYPNRDHEYPYRPNQTRMGGGTWAELDDEKAWKLVRAGIGNHRYRKAKWRGMTAYVWSEHPKAKKFTWELRIEGKIPAAASNDKGYIYLTGIQDERRAQELAAFLMASIDPKTKLEGRRWPWGSE